MVSTLLKSNISVKTYKLDSIIYLVDAWYFLYIFVASPIEKPNSFSFTNESSASEYSNKEFLILSILASFNPDIPFKTLLSSLIFFIASKPKYSTIFFALFSPQPLTSELDKNSIRASFVVNSSFLYESTLY